MVHLKGLVKSGFAALLVATLGAFALPARAATITVATLNDSGPGSLRAAIAAAGAGDTINFAVTGTITLTSGELVINTGLTISGPGPANLAISGNNASAVFNISASPVSISGLTIENGSHSLNNGVGGGGIYTLFLGTLAVANCTFSNNTTTNSFGGGIFFNGTLTVTNSSFSNNTSTFVGSGARGGGGIFFSGTLTVTDSTFSGNTASNGVGGAILTGAHTTLTVINSTFSNNSSTVVGGAGGGGGISSSGTVSVANSTFSGNTASNGTGGAIANIAPGSLSVLNSTFSENTAATGGAIANSDGNFLSVTNSTFSGNSAATGGAVFVSAIATSTVTLKNSLLAKGASGGNCFVSNAGGSVTSDGHNLSDDASCAALFTQTGDLNNTPAGLDPAGLKNNGGPTQTIALLPSSPAVDAIPVSDCTDTSGNPVTTDQRGVTRPQGPACDIGAFELVPQQTTATTVTVAASATTITLGDTVTFTATVSAGTGTPTGLVTFFDGNTPLGSGALTIVAGQNQASFSTSFLSAAGSPHSITAIYQGDATHTGSTSSAIAETVNPRTSTTGVVLNPTTVVLGQSSTATVTLTDSGSVPPGAADTFTTTGAPATGRTGFTATLFADGLVLVAGGTDANNNVLQSSEIYSVSGGTFTATGNLNTTRTGAVALLLPNGKVLIAGGSSNGLATGALNTAELFDPSAGTFTTSGNMTAARFGATVALLSNGQVLLAGGENSGGVLNTAELYNPSTNTFTATGNLNAARTGAALTLLGNGEALIAGGSSDGTANGALSSAELFDPTGNGGAGAFTAITGANSTLSAGRWQPEAALVLSGKVLIAGGQNSGGGLTSADLYDPVANDFIASNHSMAQARANGSAVALPNGMVLLAGGTTSQAVDLYDADSDKFDNTGSLQQSDTGLVSTLLNNGDVVVVGLTTAATPASDAELYAPSFNPLGAMGLSSSEVTDSFGGLCLLVPSSTTASLCTTTVTPTNVATSPHIITGTYPADAVHSTSNSTANLAVSPATTTTTVTSSQNPSIFGQSVTFTATVTDSSSGSTAQPTGSVQFVVDGVNFGSPVILTGAGSNSSTATSQATATLSVAGSPHSVTANYVNADGNFSNSNGTLTGGQTVTAASTTTTVTSSQNPSVFGQSVTFTATVSPVAPGTGTPTGTVTFLDGGSPIGTATLSGGIATFTTSALAVGSHTITTSYGGDGSFNGSTGSLTGNPQVVGKASTTTAVSSSQNPSVFGQSLTFTATVSPVAPGAGTPSGTVTFLDGGSPIGTGTLSGGIATFTTSALSTGSHTITTSYGGDVNFNGSTGSLTGNPQVVNKANTTTAVTSSQNPSVFGQSVTFTAAVSAVAPGAGTPTGTVTFNDGTTSLGTIALSAGTATFNTAALAVKSHSITAVYSGDGNFNGSSGSLTQNVQYSISVLYDQSKAVHGGATFPIKVALSDVNGVDVSSSAIVLKSVAVTMVSGFSSTPDSPGNANPDNDFRFGSTLGTNGGYIFNLSTGGLAAGTYNLQFMAGNDPVTHTVMFGVAP